MIVVLRESVARSFLCRLNQIRPLRHGRDLHARVQHMSMLFAVTLIPDEDRRRRCPFRTATGPRRTVVTLMLCQREGDVGAGAAATPGVDEREPSGWALVALSLSR
jgi:hypothetical protein